MKPTFKPRTKKEKFGAEIYNLLVENFPQTFFVGGTVRDRLLFKKAEDIDIATSATPDKIIKKFQGKRISFDDSGKSFGNIIAKKDGLTAEITTFRTDQYTGSRYPKVSFVKTPKQDSHRRDFTINSLYLSFKTGKILDFHRGLADLRQKRIRFIGKPEKRIREDPLRIIRALRFSLDLKFQLDPKTKTAIKKCFFLTNTLTKSRLTKELSKIKSDDGKRILLQISNNPKLLDKYFK